MLPQVAVGRHCCAQSTNPDNYRPLVGDALVDELKGLAKSLAAVRICKINATAAGGGSTSFSVRRFRSYKRSVSMRTGD